LASIRHARGTSVAINGVWPFEAIDKIEARASFGLDAQALYIGFMGRTVNELAWCFEALEANLDRYPKLRLALCGAPADSLKGLPSVVAERVDYLGQLSPSETRKFATAIDLGLLPLENSKFNQSRFPIKFAEYLGAGALVLCSDIGECSRLGEGLPQVLKAGRTREQWINSFCQALDLITNRQIPKVDREALDNYLWDSICGKLLLTYRSQLNS